MNINSWAEQLYFLLDQKFEDVNASAVRAFSFNQCGVSEFDSLPATVIDKLEQLDDKLIDQPFGELSETFINTFREQVAEMIAILDSKEFSEWRSTKENLDMLVKREEAKLVALEQNIKIKKRGQKINNNE